MTESHQSEEQAEESRVDSRAELLPEEREAGSDAPQEQAREILAESDERTEDPEGTQRESTQTATPDQRPE